MLKWLFFWFFIGFSADSYSTDHGKFRGTTVSPNTARLLRQNDQLRDNANNSEKRVRDNDFFLSRCSENDLQAIRSSIDAFNRQA